MSHAIHNFKCGGAMPAIMVKCCHHNTLKNFNIKTNEYRLKIQESVLIACNNPAIDMIIFITVYFILMDLSIIMFTSFLICKLTQDITFKLYLFASKYIQIYIYYNETRLNYAVSLWSYWIMLS